MKPSELTQALQSLVIEAANLKNISADQIDASAPLFGAGLGLDSLDALQIAVLVEERFGVRLPDGDEARAVFATIDALAEFISARTQ